MIMNLTLSRRKNSWSFPGLNLIFRVHFTCTKCFYLAHSREKLGVIFFKKTEGSEKGNFYSNEQIFLYSSFFYFVFFVLDFVTSHSSFPEQNLGKVHFFLQFATMQWHFPSRLPKTKFSGLFPDFIMFNINFLAFS